MQEWWDSLDSNQMEKITGYRQNKRQAFVNACNIWWENKNYDEKRKIWKEHNNY